MRSDAFRRSRRDQQLQRRFLCKYPSDHKEVLFLLNHSKDEQEVTLEDNYLDLLDKDRIRKGETIKLEKNGVRLLFHSTLTDVS